MARFPKRYLLLSSLLCVLVVSCRISKYRHLAVVSNEVISQQDIIPVIKTIGKSTTYKATIDVLSNHFSGLVVVKQTDSITKHVVFITELGMKLFDFEMKDTSFNALYVFEPLNKPALVNSLKTNFKNCLLLDVFEQKAAKLINNKKQVVFKLDNSKQKRYFVTDDSAVLLKQELFHNRKRSSKTEYLYLKEAHRYDQIKCIQYGFVKIKIELNAISND